MCACILGVWTNGPWLDRGLQIRLTWVHQKIGGVVVKNRKKRERERERERMGEEIRERKKIKMLTHQILASKSRVKGKKYHETFQTFWIEQKSFESNQSQGRQQRQLHFFICEILQNLNI